MVRKLPLNAFDEKVLNASGAAAIELKPQNHGETWLVTSASIKVIPVPPNTSLTNEPKFELYSNGTFVDGTTDGGLNATGLYETLHTNQPMRGQWTGGDVGATAQMRLGGLRYLDP